MLFVTDAFQDDTGVIFGQLFVLARQFLYTLFNEKYFKNMPDDPNAKLICHALLLSVKKILRKKGREFTTWQGVEAKKGTSRVSWANTHGESSNHESSSSGVSKRRKIDQNKEEDSFSVSNSFVFKELSMPRRQNENLMTRIEMLENKDDNKKRNKRALNQPPVPR